MLAAGLTFGDLAEGGGVTCVGGGAGSLPMALLQAFPELAVDVVEIDPVVAQAAATFLGLRARGGGPPEEAFLRGLRPRPKRRGRLMPTRRRRACRRSTWRST